jgi:pimeloyl-ACP methyl ester carboxylesterase
LASVKRGERPFAFIGSTDADVWALWRGEAGRGIRLAAEGTGQRNNYCRPCRTAYKHEHYAKHRQRYIDSARRRTNRVVLEEIEKCVAAAVSQVPFLDLARQAHRSPPRVTARMLRVAAAGGRLPVVGQPDEAALINAPGAEAGWRHVVAIGEDSRWRNRVSARWLLGRPYRPARHAARLHCPWLVCVGEADRVARPGPAIAAARRAPLGELRIYPGVDHFDIYDGPEHEMVVADEVEFLRRHLL